MKPILLLSLLLLPCAAFADSPSRSLCSEFLRLIEKPRGSGIELKQIENSIPVGGTEADSRYFNIDIDGDDINDTLELSCSASLIPADPCLLTVTLSSGGKVEFSQERFFLVRHRAKIYAVAADLGPKRKKGTGQVFRVESSGVHLVCSHM
jgi:hypothetical protein